ncbi:MAG: ATP-dependent DNA helicase, partial [Bacteroidetes bacterium]|nr:ATP-dependent DNA helicase [Bacteroidota bacterium]
LPELNLPPKKPSLPKNFVKAPSPKSSEESVVPDSPPAEIDLIQTGMEVIHERFGKGKVVNLEGVGPNRKATVFFPAIGQKQLLLRFARLRIAD